MRNNLGYGNKEASVTVALLLGSIVSLIVTIIGAVILSKLMDAEMIQESSVGYAVPLILIAASYLGCRIGAGKYKRKGMMISMVVAGIYLTVLMSINALFFEAQFNGVGVTLLVILCGFGLAALPKKEKRRSKLSRNYKIPTR